MVPQGDSTRKNLMSHIIEADWTTEAGLRAVITVGLRDNGSRTHRCGYVGIPKGHVLFGIRYGDNVACLRRYADQATIGQKSPVLVLTAGVNAPEGETIRSSPDVVYDVHGGLTFSDGFDTYPVKSELWWFGFDCAHYGDSPIDADDFGFHGGVVRSKEYCVQECERLARQIVETCPSVPPSQPTPSRPSQ